MKTAKAYFIILIIVSLFFPFVLQAFTGKPVLSIATNKEYYDPAETIQFDVFLLNADLNNHHTFFVELLDCKGRKLAKKMLPFIFSVSPGNIELPVNTDADFYLLYCYVLSKNNVEADCIKKIFITDKKVNSAVIAGNKIKIDCFPEGGNLVSGITNNLLVRAVDDMNNPIAVSCKLVDEDNKVLNRFSTGEDGYASIAVNLRNNISYYIATGEGSTAAIKKALPYVSSSGITLNVSVTDSSIIYTAFSLITNEKMLDYKLQVISNSQVVYNSEISFQLNRSYIMDEIRLAALPEGFLSFLLTDHTGKTYAQRIIYNDTAAFKKFITIVDTVNKKQAIIELPEYIDGNGYVKIFIADANDPHNSNLGSQPVLQEKYNKMISFNGRLISVENIPGNSSNTETGKKFLTISGIVYDSEDKPVKNRKINFIILQKNLKKDFFIANTDRAGKFEISNLIFYDTAKLYYQLSDRSEEKNDVRIELEVSPSISAPGNETALIDLICKTQTAGTDTGKTANRLPEKTLKDVIISSRKKDKTDSEKFEDKYVSGQHNSKNFVRNEFDFIKNPEVNNTKMLFDFLQGRVSGLIIRIASDGTPVISSSSFETIGVYLNDMEIAPSQLDMLSYLQVKDVALVKYYSMSVKPKTASVNPRLRMAFGDGGDLMIYTKGGFIISDPKVKGMPKISIVGYDIEKPVREPSNGSTFSRSLYWKPDWIYKSGEVIYISLPEMNGNEIIQLSIEGINTLTAPYSFSKKLVFN